MSDNTIVTDVHTMHMLISARPKLRVSFAEITGNIILSSQESMRCATIKYPWLTVTAYRGSEQSRTIK